MKLANTRIGVRLAFSFAAILLLMVVSVGVSIQRFGHVRDGTRQLIEIEWVKFDAAATIDGLARANARRTMELLLAHDAAQLARVRERIADNRRQIDEALVTLDKLVARPKGRELLETLKARRVEYVSSFTAVATAVAEGRRDQALQRLNDETLPAIDRLQDAIRALKGFQTALVQETAGEIQAGIERARQLMIVLVLGALLLGASLAWVVTRSITRPVGRAVDVARTVASGDLTSQREQRSTDETGQLLKALDDMNGSLVRIVGDVHAGSEAISTATGQIAAGNHDLSQRTEEQAAALQQTSASLQELTGTVKSNLDTARHASELAADASNVALEGGTVVGQVVQSMQAIELSARKIADIVGVIDGIAFQTNLLALNAAVEAARAGEQGRGFAVVANEVRTLAGRASGAARQIKDLVGDSVQHVGEGSQRVDEAGRTMADIVQRVQRVATLMGEISQASEAQASGLDQISQAMGQMDHVTQGNAALVEESAAATESLAQQARALVDLVGAFRLARAA